MVEETAGQPHQLVGLACPCFAGCNVASDLDDSCIASCWLEVDSFKLDVFEVSGEVLEPAAKALRSSFVLGTVSCTASDGIRRAAPFSFGAVPEAGICLMAQGASASEATACVSLDGGIVLDVGKACEDLFVVDVIGAEPVSEEAVDFEDLGRVR